SATRPFLRFAKITSVRVSATPRSADWCRKLIEGGAEERVAALRDGRGVQRAAVAGEPREPLAVNHGRRVERGDGIPVGTAIGARPACRCQPSNTWAGASWPY